MLISPPDIHHCTSDRVSLDVQDTPGHIEVVTFTLGSDGVAVLHCGRGSDRATEQLNFKPTYLSILGIEGSQNRILRCVRRLVTVQHIHEGRHAKYIGHDRDI